MVKLTTVYNWNNYCLYYIHWIVSYKGKVWVYQWPELKQKEQGIWRTVRMVCTLWLCGKHEYLLVLVVIDNKHHCLRAFRKGCLIKTKNWLGLVLSSVAAVGVESDELMVWIERVQIWKEECYSPLLSYSAIQFCLYSCTICWYN